MGFDEIPQLPEISKAKIYLIDQEQALHEFASSKCKFMFYESDKGDTRFIFEELDASLYAALVIKLSNSIHQDAYEFLKLVLEGTRLIRQQTKKSFDIALKIEKHLKKKNKLV